jgi:hypothetical protein
MITAAEAIGEYQPQDWHLDPCSHAQRMAREAGPLQRILQGSRVQVILEQYEAGNAKAGEYQAGYKRYGRWEIYLGSAAAIIGAVILYLASGGDGDKSGLLSTGLLVAQGFCLAGAIALKYKLGHSTIYRQWQQQRTRAETSRIELFETACGLAGHPVPPSVTENELALLPLQLEYFLRYQLQVQLNYYHERGRQHAKAARRFVNIGTVITFLAAVAASLAGLNTELGDWVSSSAIVGLVAPILLTAQSSLSRLNQDERNAARYAITHDHLLNLKKKSDSVRSAAEGGNQEEVFRFIRSVNEVISVEHTEWKERQARDDEPDTAAQIPARSTTESHRGN